MKKLVFVCSPYAGDVDLNTKSAIFFCLQEMVNGNVPIAPHLIYPRIISEEDGREQGISMGLEILRRCDRIHVYGRKITSGMRREIIFAFKNRIPVVFMDEVDISDISTHQILK